MISPAPIQMRCQRSGLTLLEVLLAMGLMMLVSAMMFMFYDTTLRVRQHVRRAVNDGYLARTIADQIAEEIRAANGFVTSIGPGISGDNRVITIQTVTMPDPSIFRRLSIKDQPLPAESDIRQVQYYLAYDPDETHTYPDGTEGDAPLGLVRREIKTLFQTTVLEKDAKSVNLDLVAPELKYIRFRYFDGVDWLDKWDIGGGSTGALGNSLPQAVEVTIGYTELPPPETNENNQDQTNPDLAPSEPEPYSTETYRVVVRLPQADSFFGSRLQRAQRRSSLGASGG